MAVLTLADNPNKTQDRNVVDDKILSGHEVTTSVIISVRNVLQGDSALYGPVESNLSNLFTLRLDLLVRDTHPKRIYKGEKLPLDLHPIGPG